MANLGLLNLLFSVLAFFTQTSGSLSRASYTHTPPLTHAGALTRGVSFTQGSSHTRAASRAHVVPSRCGAPFTHGVPGSTHAGTLATTPLAHGGSLGVALTLTHGDSFALVVSGTHGVSLAHGVSSRHGVPLAHEGAFAHTLPLPVCVLRRTHTG